MLAKRLRYAVVLLLCGLANPDFAAGLNSYIAVGVGNTNAHVAGSAGQETLSSAAYRVVAGSQISPLLSFETEYIDFGQFSRTSSLITAKGLGISGVLEMPLSDMFSLYGRAGYTRVETISASPSGATSPVSDMVAGLSLGYGLQINVAPNASIRLAWNRYPSSSLGAIFTDRINMDSSGLLIFRF